MMGISVRYVILIVCNVKEIINHNVQNAKKVHFYYQHLQVNVKDVQEYVTNVLGVHQVVLLVKTPTNIIPIQKPVQCLVNLMRFLSDFPTVVWKLVILVILFAKHAN